MGCSALPCAWWGAPLRHQPFQVHPPRPPPPHHASCAVSGVQSLGTMQTTQGWGSLLLFSPRSQMNPNQH